MARQDTSPHWRDSGLTPLLFYIDARGAFAILLVLLKLNWYTISIAVVVITILSFLNYYKIPLVAAFRLLRQLITGPKKIIVERK
ncbi:MAG: IcmT/TraK family protein [Gammaproteobacteria bacterium]|nr:IcmT/TraK family protein [Gammaproteobacteria bacterium]